MIRLGNNEVLKTLTKTLTFLDAADAEGRTIALRERCSGELIEIGYSYKMMSHCWSLLGRKYMSGKMTEGVTVVQNARVVKMLISERRLNENQVLILHLLLKQV